MGEGMEGILAECKISESKLIPQETGKCDINLKNQVLFWHMKMKKVKVIWCNEKVCKIK